MATEYQGQSLKINYFPSTESYEINKDTLDESSINLIPSQTVVEAYSNGTEWYRVWSDGWIEQGGYYTQTLTSAGNVSIQLLQPMADTNYSILTTIDKGTTTNNSGSQYLASIHSDRTTTTFIVRVDQKAYVVGFYWKVSGKKA